MMTVNEAELYAQALNQPAVCVRGAHLVWKHSDYPLAAYRSLIGGLANHGKRHRTNQLIVVSLPAHLWCALFYTALETVCLGPQRIVDADFTSKSLLHPLISLGYSQTEEGQFRCQLHVMADLLGMGLTMAAVDSALAQAQSVTDDQFTTDLPQPLAVIAQAESGDHLNYAFEVQLKLAVRLGNTSAIPLILQSMYHSGRIGVLARDNPLRLMKNFAIICISVCLRAAVEHGLDWEIVYSLNDDYVAELEELDNSESVMHYIEHALIDLATRMAAINRNTLSPPIARVFHFLLNNSATTANLSQLAHMAGLSPKYLSSLFNQQVGLPLTKFKNLIRISNAIVLLQTTSLPLSRIAAQLNFADQAHFTRTFISFTGYTPTQAKREPNLLNEWHIEAYLSGPAVAHTPSVRPEAVAGAGALVARAEDDHYRASSSPSAGPVG